MLKIHKYINIQLSAFVLIYSFLAVGHLGHKHYYGKADPGYCTSQCHNPEHFDTKPLCKGFPVNLNLGDLHEVPNSSMFPPVFSPECMIIEIRVATSQHDFKDQSRAPPVC